MRLYIDACCIIYAIEGLPQFRDPVLIRHAEISAAIIDRATELRARHNFKTPDAIHLATAIEEKADAFLTGDAALARCSEIQIDVI